jgi:hypothetical protein
LPRFHVSDRRSCSGSVVMLAEHVLHPDCAVAIIRLFVMELSVAM